jgi:hypothetical protein
LPARQFKEPERRQETDTGIARKFVQQLEHALATRALIRRGRKLPLGVDRGGLINHRTRRLEGLTVERIQPTDCRETRVDRPYPQLGEALGTERFQRCGAQGVPVDASAAGRGRDRVDQAASGSLTDVWLSLLLD